jgi:O-antigen ligase
MHAWSQAICLALSATGFTIAVWPRRYEGELNEQNRSFRLLPWRKLRRFPIFWLGLALIALIACEALNPSWTYVRTAKLWWLTRTQSVLWLPTSIAAPFDLFNSWRSLIICMSAWLTACAVWVGITRRRSLRILLTVFVVDGLVLSGLLVAQHVAGDARIPWPLTAWTQMPLVGSFIYKNHAGAYIALAAFAAVAMATWHSDHGARMLKKSTPGAALSLAAAFLGGAVFFTLSRGAALTLIQGLGTFLAWLFLRQRFGPATLKGNPAVARIIGAVFVIFALVALHYLDFSAIYSRFDAMAVQGEGESSVRSRILIHQAAHDMLRDSWLRGIGAGGFRYLSPEYVRHYPEIYQGGQLYWDHAHGDWLEFPIEYGLAGDLLLLAGLGWWVWWFSRRKTGWNPLAVPLLIGCAQTLVHAGFDFPFQCPAILITWCVLLTMAGRWMELEG